MLSLLILAAATQTPAPPPAPPARAEAYYRFSLAQQARLSGDRDEAMQELHRALDADPTSGEIHAELARLLRDSGQVEAAIKEARKGIEVEPDNASPRRVLAQLLQANASFGDGDTSLAEAAGQYERVLEIEPDDRLSLIALGQIYDRLQRHEDAIRIWSHYVEMDPGSFEAYQRLGSHYLALGKADEAAQALGKALQLQPDSASAQQSLGDTYAQSKDLSKAVDHYRKALELEPANLLVRVKLGEALMREGRAKEAGDEANTILAKDPQNRYGLDLLGRALRDQRRFDEADEVVNRLRALDEKDLKAAYLQITIAEARHDYAKAVELLQTVLARDRSGEDEADTASNDRAFLVHLGFAQQQLGQYAEAAQSFQKAAELSSEDDPDIEGYRIDALLQAGDLDTALSAARAAMEKHPDDVSLRALEAAVLRKQGDAKGAQAAIAPLEAPDQPVDSLLTAAEYHQRGKDYAAAESVLRRALEVEPKSLRVLFQLGAVLERQSRRDEAEKVFRKALEIEPDSAPVLNYLGYMNADRHVRVEEALGLIQKAVDLDPNNGAYLDSLGWALFRLNRLDEAEARIRAALQSEGNNAVILDHLGDVLERRGARDEAVSEWRKALAGEDEDGELDRAAVERKIRETVAAAPSGSE